MNIVKETWKSEKGQESEHETCVFYASTYGAIFAHERFARHFLTIYWWKRV